MTHPGMRYSRRTTVAIGDTTVEVFLDAADGKLGLTMAITDIDGGFYADLARPENREPLRQIIAALQNAADMAGDPNARAYQPGEPPRAFVPRTSAKAAERFGLAESVAAPPPR